LQDKRDWNEMFSNSVFLVFKTLVCAALILSSFLVDLEVVFCSEQRGCKAAFAPIHGFN
jgi:hypothetical protein